jgi:TolA-binding protein
LKKSRFALDFCVIILLLGSGVIQAQDSPGSPQRPSRNEFKARYDRVMELFQQKKFDEAATAFQTLLESDRENQLAGNCQFWIGECRYGQRRYEAAIAAFEKVFAYPNSFKIDAAQYKIALCFLQMKRYPEARDEFSRLISAYPSSEFVARARTQLDQIP